jgi:hypothetical protein
MKEAIGETDSRRRENPLAKGREAAAFFEVRHGRWL